MQKAPLSVCTGAEVLYHSMYAPFIGLTAC